MQKENVRVNAISAWVISGLRYRESLLCFPRINKLVLIGIVVAVPLAWPTANQWVQDFFCRIEVQWWMFSLAGLLGIMIALLTVSFQSVKAALMNPFEEPAIRIKTNFPLPAGAFPKL